MIVGCYSLELYCENASDTTRHQEHAWEIEFPHTYTGLTLSECTGHARKQGWIINHRNGTAICPSCSKKKYKRGVR